MQPQDEVRTKIRAMLPLDDLAHKVLSSLQCSVRISLREEDADIMLGQSRFGGWPDVPADFVWPTCTGLSNPNWWREWIIAENGGDPATYDKITLANCRSIDRPMYSKPHPLSLLAQINLGELPLDWNIDLPSEGQLLVFCDMEELVHGGRTEPLDRWRVMLLPACDSSWSERPRPGDDPARRPPIRGLNFAPEWTISDDLQYHSDDEITAAAVRVREMLIGSWGKSQHRLRGHAQPIQGHLEYEAEDTLRQLGYGQSLSEAEADQATLTWKSLIQFDNEEAVLGWMWGDVGRMHFMIREEDLRNRRFDQVVAFLRCH